jgi:hypothetical protein
MVSVQRCGEPFKTPMVGFQDPLGEDDIVRIEDDYRRS